MIDQYLSESLGLLRSIDKHLAVLVAALPGPGILVSHQNPFAPPFAVAAQSVEEYEHSAPASTSPTSFAPEVMPEPVTPAVGVVAQQLQTVAEPKFVATVSGVPVPVANDNKSYADSFNELKDLLESETWPMAVDPDLICHDESDDDKELRAEGIIEFLIDEDLEGKRFLDYGCSEGHVVRKSLEKKPALAMGFDLHRNESWDRLVFPEGEKHGLTDDWNQIAANGPFDVVLLYDVLDHLEGDHVAELKKLRSVMAPGGRIYVRCHPWCSRHATHLYKKVNKAFPHLVFSDVELARLGLGTGLKTHKIIHPHLVYKQWFNDSGLDLINENAIQENLEDFFHMNPIVNERIKDNWRGTSIDPQLAAGKGFPGYQLRIQFVDYLLKSD
jgi:SAM-dependent methyltransferase